MICSACGTSHTVSFLRARLQQVAYSLDLFGVSAFLTDSLNRPCVTSSWYSHTVAQSMGLPGQPNHPRIKEFEAEVAARVHAAGRKMTSDVIVAAGATRLFLDGAREFLRAEKGS